MAQVLVSAESGPQKGARLSASVDLECPYLRWAHIARTRFMFCPCFFLGHALRKAHDCAAGSLCCRPLRAAQSGAWSP